MEIFQDHISLGTILQLIAIIGATWKVLGKLTPIIQNHQRNERWLETLWEEYNQRFEGTWRIAPGNPSERLHIYRPHRSKDAA